VCEFTAEALPLKLESPPYVPVIEYGPALGKAISQGCNSATVSKNVLKQLDKT